ncbi:NAD(P)-dependent oxidoreductase [Paraburkholderia silvatlantica]|uniref:3-hydroxyisobutyrate dehydrogenase n=1 Tax=Paraburkholderia silvatlantica TaxID=321895 RepID=A0A2U1ABM1_9BURK|nr:NAD(P)-dependent oxidoreductase [Paraburkholderia silvatlantica]MBB2930341.1 3-hydroxyisobutyrate dehydrogenase [Paraburkholderia silvatlantica]PVY32171.1 3-hydroxyisobutyrate dehydrogenase [Paraburkholderia silvatlantica]PXW37791.1 3-hydroxyisobutyrate dehydrogenase [Paraburkholderia silvatlantica]PYE25612.1 3-hydroxyisobutyrate dehydrogenase [Paraburkholderia silvatlantica]TDQ97745.1 3-hydroxyisobutyrate dehydrogenase [Paraburkholderia silvatlantica]
MTQPQRIGFIGLGMMGAPMVQCLVNAGFGLFIDDADAARADALAAQTGAQRLGKDNAASLDALITMLPNSAIVESVLLGGGADGWASRLAKGAVVIDMSSSEPGRSRKLGSVLEERGLAYLDAPVSGGVKKAKEGTLAILVGGSAEELVRCKPVLEAMGKSILHIGGAGAGHAAKALNNYVSAAGLAATVEALHVAQRFGIEPDVMTDVLNASSGRSNTSENKVKPFMLSGTFASGFALQLMNKDLKIARALAQSVGYPMTLGMTCTAMWDEAAQRSTPATDHTEMYRLLDGDAS